MRVHFNTIHNINNLYRNIEFNKIAESNITLQTFFTNARNTKYFISSLSKPIALDIISTTSNTSSNNIEDNNPASLNNIRDYLDSYNKEEEEKARSIALNFNNLETRDLNPIYKRLHWHKYLNGLNIPKLIETITSNIPATKKEEEDKELCYFIYKEVVNLCRFSTSLIEKYSREILFNINTENLDPNKKDMLEFKPLEANSARRYFAIIGQLIIYIIKFKDNNLDKEYNYPKITKGLANLISAIKECALLYKNNYNNTIYRDRLYSYLLYIIPKLLKQPTRQVNLEGETIFNSPVITFLIISCLNPKDNTLRDASYIEQRCSYLIYTIRLLSLGYFYYKEKEAIKNNIEFNLDLVFSSYYSTYLTNKSNNCFSELCLSRAYTRTIAINIPTKSRIVDINKDLVAIDNKEVSIPALSKFYNSILDNLEDILFSKLIEINPNLLMINLDDIKDDIHNKAEQFYFYKLSSSNYSISRFKDYLTIVLLGNNNNFSNKYLASFNKRTKEVKFKVEIDNWLNYRLEFIDLLSLAIYLLAGSPIRGTEVEQVKYINTAELGDRNLYIDNSSGLFRIETTYSKSGNITGLDKSTIRFLSPRLSNILKLYLLIVIPFYKYVSIKYLGIESISPYLLEYNNNRITSNRISTLLGIRTLKELGSSITINPYRQLIKYILKTRLGIDSSSIEDEEELIEDTTSNHTTFTSLMHYGREYNLFINRNSNIEKRSLDLNKLFFKFFKLDNASFNYSKLATNIIISPKKGRARSTSSIDIGYKKVKPTIYNIEEEKEEELEEYNNYTYNSPTPYSSNPNNNNNNILSLSKANNNKQAIRLRESISLLSSQSNSSFTLSQANNNFNNPTSTLPKSSYSNLSSQDKLKIVQENIKLRKLTLNSSFTTTSSLEVELGKLLKDPNARFRTPKQQEVIENIINKVPSITYISSTGSGKSLLFNLPSYIYPNRKFIVIVPRISLVEDLNRQALKLGLNSIIWTPDSNINANLIFISIENAVLDIFTSYIYTLKASNFNITIYFDEAHLIVLEPTFRPKLKGLSSIVALELQLVFISATLPISLIDILEQEFLIIEPLIIRDSTTRSNIKYITKELPDYKQESLVEYLKDTIKEGLSNCIENERGIIFTNTKNLGFYLAKELKIPFIYSSKDPIEKANNIKLLNKCLDPKSNIKVFISTNLAGVGISRDFLKFSIHIPPIFSLVYLDQEIGRIGRNNKKAYAYILYRPKKGELEVVDPSIISFTTIEEFNKLDLYKAKQFLYSKGCLRIVLEEFLNNKVIDSCSTLGYNIVKCQLCLDKESILTRAKDKYIGRVIDNRSSSNLLLDKLEYINNRICINCIIDKELDSKVAFNHNYNTCSYPKDNLNRAVAGTSLVIRRDKLIPHNICCLSCFLPNNICSNKGDFKKTCTYKDVFPRFIVLMHFIIKWGFFTSFKHNKELYNIKEVKRTSSYLALLDSITLALCSSTKIDNKDSLIGIEVLLTLDFNALEKLIKYNGPSSQDGIAANLEGINLISSSITKEIEELDKKEEELSSSWEF